MVRLLTQAWRGELSGKGKKKKRSQSQLLFFSNIFHCSNHAVFSAPDQILSGRLYTGYLPKMYTV